MGQLRGSVVTEKESVCRPVMGPRRSGFRWDTRPTSGLTGARGPVGYNREVGQVLTRVCVSRSIRIDAILFLPLPRCLELNLPINL